MDLQPKQNLNAGFILQPPTLKKVLFIQPRSFASDTAEPRALIRNRTVFIRLIYVTRETFKRFSNLWRRKHHMIKSRMAPCSHAQCCLYYPNVSGQITFFLPAHIYPLFPISVDRNFSFLTLVDRIQAQCSLLLLWVTCFWLRLSCFQRCSTMWV